MHKRSLTLFLTVVATSTICLGASQALAQGTPGYWKNHSDVTTNQYNDTWDMIGGPDASFLNRGESWLDVLKRPTHGDEYYILGKQYVAALLNTKAQAYSEIKVLSLNEINEAGVVAKVQLAETMLRGLKAEAVRIGDDKQSPDRPSREDFIALSRDLDRYNNLVAEARDAAEALEDNSEDMPLNRRIASWGKVKTLFD